jgi:hypothetical protein
MVSFFDSLRENHWADTSDFEPMQVDQSSEGIYLLLPGDFSHKKDEGLDHEAAVSPPSVNQPSNGRLNGM